MPVKNMNEFVKLVHIGQKGKDDNGRDFDFTGDLKFVYNGGEFTVFADKGFGIFERHEAEHAMKGEYKHGAKQHTLKLEELPEGERNPRNIAGLMDSFDAKTKEAVEGLTKQIESQDLQISELKSENASYVKTNDRLSKAADEMRDDLIAAGKEIDKKDKEIDELKAQVKELKKK